MSLVIYHFAEVIRKHNTNATRKIIVLVRLEHIGQLSLISTIKWSRSTATTVYDDRMEQRPDRFPDSKPTFERVLKFADVKKADHISVGRPWFGKEYIVEDTDQETQTIHVIGWRKRK